MGTRQLEAATNSASPNVQVSAAAAVLPAETREKSTQSALTPGTPAKVDLNVSWGTDGLLTLENKGVNAPASMQTENLAAPATSNNGNAQGQDSTQTDSAESTEGNLENRDNEEKG